jgi:hypothetical protein
MLRTTTLGLVCGFDGAAVRLAAKGRSDNFAAAPSVSVHCILILIWVPIGPAVVAVVVDVEAGGSTMRSDL